MQTELASSLFLLEIKVRSGSETGNLAVHSLANATNEQVPKWGADRRAYTFKSS